MKFLYFYFVLIALSFQSYANAEEDTRNPIDKFRGTSQYYTLMCQIKSLGTSYDELLACLSEGRAEVKKLFPLANKTLAKKPALSKLLKEYYIAWMSAFDAINSAPGEIEINHDRRSKEAAAKAEEAWNRFEVEQTM